MNTTLDFNYGSVTLNQEQYSVVSAPADSHQRILASAGSGKTTTISARIAWLLTHSDVSAEQIVLLTFSRNSARDMLKRVRRLVGNVNIWSGTFHAIANEVLTSIGGVGATAHLLFIDELPVCLLNWMRSPKGREWVSTLRYVVVDEFQDINEIQWKILETMRHVGCRSIIVGDDAQNIYTWRGSSANYLLDFHTVVPEVKDYQLRMNYRSTEAIVAVANRIVEGIPTLAWKEKMIANKSGGIKPDVLFFPRIQDETKWIAKKIHEIRSKQGGTIAVLARNNIHLNHVEETFARHGIKTRFLTHDGTLEEDEYIVDLSTFHGAKGLEWDTTFLISLNDDYLPSRKSPDEVIGERRLFYVACTRACKYMYFTYHGNERTLSRFVREIGYKYLTFHGLAKYALSTYEGASGLPSLKSLLDSVDGVEWQKIRKMGLVPWRDNEIIPIRRKQFFPNGESWRIPEWAEHKDFEAFVRFWIKRCLLELRGWQDPFKDSAKERMIFTLSIFKDDKPFWDAWSEDLNCMARHLFADTKVLNHVLYTDVEVLALNQGLTWSHKEVIEATSILSKIRGQLTCLRNEDYNLDEFTISPTHRCVSTEYRLDCLRSWKRCVDKKIPWHNCLIDIWRISCLEQVSEGRHAGLYRASNMKDHLESCIPFLEALEGSLISNFDISDEISLNPEFHMDDITPATTDFIIGQNLVRICGEKKPDFYIWVESWLLAYLSVASMGKYIKQIQIIHPFHGLIWNYPNINLTRAKGLYEALIKIWRSKNIRV